MTTPIQTAIVIPARYASSRYPGKMLAPLRGATGVAKSLTQRSWEAAMAVPGVERVIIAVDDDRVAEAAQGFGADVVMTDPACRNGTERVAEALTRGLLGDVAEDAVIVNLQGDAPLTPPWFVTALVDAMRADPTIETATPALRCDGTALERFREDRKADRVGGTTLVFRPGQDGAPGDALYFSKEVIPFTAERYEPKAPTPVFHHVGVYAYRPAALLRYKQTEVSELETLEGLEQLRFLAAGTPMRVVEVDAHGREFCELNNPVDVDRIERVLAELDIE